MKLFTNFIILVLSLGSITLSAQEKPFDVGAKMNEINRLLKDSDPSLKRFDRILLKDGNVVIWDCHKQKSTNCVKQYIPASKLSLEKLKVVKHRPKPKYVRVKSKQILITSNGDPAVKYMSFKSLKKQYRITVESKEVGEKVIVLLKEVLSHYRP